MKAASCSFPAAAGRGDRWGRRRSCDTTTNMTAFLLWPPSVCRLSANAWGCFCGSSRGTSAPQMSPPSFACFCATCGGRSSCCGTMVASTRGHSLLNCEGRIRVFISNHSPAMLRNSIPSSRSGMTSRAIPPIACFGIRSISEAHSTIIHGGSVAPKISCDRSSLRRTCLRHPGESCVTYAKPYKTCSVFPERALSYLAVSSSPWAQAAAVDSRRRGCFSFQAAGRVEKCGKRRKGRA